MNAVRKLTSSSGRPDLYLVTTPVGTVVERDRAELEHLARLDAALGHWRGVLAAVDLMEVP